MFSELRIKLSRLHQYTVQYLATQSQFNIGILYLQCTVHVPKFLENCCHLQMWQRLLIQQFSYAETHN